MDKMNYIEAQAQAWANFSLETMELLNKRAHTVVTLMLGGGGALMAYVFTLLERKTALWLVVLAAVAALWLMAWATVGVFRCVRTLSMVPPGNMPGPLLISQQSLEDMRRERLVELGGRVQAWGQRNVRQAEWLDRIYFAAAATPVAAGAAAWATWAWCASRSGVTP